MYQPISIHNIPSAVWGPSSEKVILAVHGNLSSKTDTPIRLLAETAVQKGYQVLSFDLPEHGDRKKEPTLCKVQNCVSEWRQIIEYAQKNWKDISLFANSIGETAENFV